MSQTITALAAQTTMPGTRDGTVLATFELLQAEIDLICDSFGPRPTALPLIRNLLDFDLGVPAGLLSPRPVAADFLHTEDGYEITVELPGLDENDVEIAAGEGVLTMRADRQGIHTGAPQNRTYLSERRFGQVLRSFRLPDAADAERLSVSSRRGVLCIRIPRR